jgi:hypothetical protein
MEEFYTLATTNYKLFFMGPIGDREIFLVKEPLDAEKVFTEKDVVEMLNIVKRKTKHCFLDENQQEIPLPTLVPVKVIPNFIIEEVITGSQSELLSYKETLLKELNQVEQRLKKIDDDCDY